MTGFFVCYDPAEAERDEQLRQRHLDALQEMIDGSDKLTKTKRAELAGVISTKAHLKRYLRATPGGLLRVDAAAISREANLDGKYLLCTCDPKLSAEDDALGYSSSSKSNAAGGTSRPPWTCAGSSTAAKTASAPTCSCWLALLLIRIAENRTVRHWPDLRRELDRIHLGLFTGPPAPSPAEPTSPRPHRHPERARPAPAPADRPGHPRNPLTSPNAWPSDTPPHRTQTHSRSPDHKFTD